MMKMLHGKHALIAALIAALALFAVACGGDDDDGDNNNGDATATRTGGTGNVIDPAARTATIAAARTAGIDIEATESAAYTAVAQGTEVPGFTPQAVGGDATPPGAGDTPAPGETAEPAPTETPPAHGFIATITLDGNPDTPEIDHGELTAPVGAALRVAVVVQDPPKPYQGYQIGFRWQEPTLSFVGEETTKPGVLTTCPPATTLDFTTGIYSGCISVEQPSTFSGVVSYLTVRCEQAGTARIHLMTLLEAQEFGTSLLEPGGVAFAGEVDEGIRVRCT